jgi:DNA polymerase
MQNLPSRGENAGRIKKAIMAPVGYVVIDCDSSQIEARVLAWLAGQDDLVAAFERKEDVYKIMAAKIYKVAVADVTPAQRTVGKTIILGAGYGVGHLKLKLFLKQQAGVIVTTDTAKAYIDTYRSANDKIPKLWRKGEDALRELTQKQSMVLDAQELLEVIPGRGIKLPNGLFIQYPDLRKVVDEESGKASWVYTSKGLPVHVYGGKVIENVCQAVARIIIGEQMLRIAKRYKCVLTVHDAIAVIAKVGEADAARAYVEECMNWRPTWAQTLPLACESGMGKSYGDC